MNRTLVTIQLEAWYLYLLTAIMLTSLFFSIAGTYYKRKTSKYAKLTERLLGEMKDEIETKVAKDIAKKRRAKKDV